jgi:hypothetical protein
MENINYEDFCEITFHPSKYSPQLSVHIFYNSLAYTKFAVCKRSLRNQKGGEV